MIKRTGISLENRDMKRRTIGCAVFFMAAAAVSGCKLEPAFDGVFCPEGHIAKLGHVQYYGSNCYAEDCQSEADCCDISDDSLRKQVWDSLRYNRCPAGSNFPECGFDGDTYFCYNGCPVNMGLCGDTCVFFNDYTHIDHCDGKQVVCADGYADCDDDVTTGCESDLTVNTDINDLHCGA